MSILFLLTCFVVRLQRIKRFSKIDKNPEITFYILNFVALLKLKFKFEVSLVLNFHINSQYMATLNLLFQDYI